MIPRWRKKARQPQRAVTRPLTRVGEVRLRIDADRLPVGAMSQKRWVQNLRQALEKAPAPSSIDEIKRRILSRIK